MAPKKAAKSTATAKKKAAKEIAAQKGTPLKPSTLLGQADQDDVASARKRQRPSRDLEQMVAKVLRDNFRGFTREQMDVMVVDGKTLRQDLFDDREADEANKVQGKFGMHYYAEKRRKYLPPCAPQRCSR
jgi:hypothetical protein